MKKNIFSFLITTLLKVLSCLVIAIIISIIVEWIGMSFIWKNNPQHAKEMLNYEYSLVSDSFQHFMFGGYFLDAMNDFFLSLYRFAYKSFITIKHEHNAESSLGFLSKFVDYIKAAGYITILVLMRAFVFLLSLPWFLICGVVAFMDGLVERSIRKYEGGVEHGMIHHLAKSNFNFVIGTAFILYLGIPIAIHPSIIIIPFGILFGAIIYVAAWSFKKYL